MATVTAKEKFLWGLVTGTFIKFRTLGLDEDSLTLARKVIAAFPNHNEGVIRTWADCMVHTVALEFNWPDRAQVPDVFLSLEDFWQMYQEGASPELCYEFYTRNVGNDVMFSSSRRKVTDWQDAMMKAQKVWEPPDEWKMLDDLPEEKRNDPLSSSVIGKSDSN